MKAAGDPSKERRSSRGSGTARRRPDGRWEVRVVIGGRRVSFMGHTLTEAHRKADEARASGERPRRADTPTVAEWLGAWLDASRDRLDPQTWRSYEQHARLSIVPAIGSTRLAALTDAHMDRLHRFCRQRLGPSTAHHVHATLSSALSAAVKRGLIRTNIAKAVPAPRRADSDMNPYTPAQVERLLKTVRGDRLEALYVLAVTMGPRLGELLALRWRDVDLDRGRIRIVGTAVAAGYGVAPVIAPPKTRASQRTLHPLPAIVVTALRRTPRVAGSDLVWPAELKGGPMRGATLQRKWRRVCAAAGIPYTGFHNLRHTAATVMLDDGVPPHVVSNILGHASVGITLQLYAHVTRSGLGAAAAAVDARYGTA